MTGTINTLIFDEELCRDSEDLMILTDLELEEEQRLSQPITGNINCLNLLLTMVSIVAYALVSIVL